VIAKDEVMPLLVAACPSFREPWKRYLACPSYQEGLLYVDLSEFAHHLVELMETGSTQEFPAVFEVVERLHIDGDSFVKQAATVGLLEGIQNIASHTDIDPESFVSHLKHESANRWKELNDLWDSMARYVGAGIKPEK
jgi:hypothetical protein